ncbi:uncharacterized protein K441DRAFT_292314 [Cenococcum geophilum 1.58]|uniref:uncharacterized protein n=1 Tax=Cenococcum geophilum 1.58 TaxID=794803 RepID=UPI00358F99A0|nr:hypothetical protein K441DRAFT_292314 [Cenococcum geophilum 1.58]
MLAVVIHWVPGYWAVLLEVFSQAGFIIEIFFADPSICRRCAKFQSATSTRRVAVLINPVTVDDLPTFLLFVKKPVGENTERWVAELQLVHLAKVWVLVRVNADSLLAHLDCEVFGVEAGLRGQTLHHASRSGIVRNHYFVLIHDDIAMSSTLNLHAKLRGDSLLHGETPGFLASKCSVSSKPRDLDALNRTFVL